MSIEEITFGEFLRQKRKDKEITLRKFADMLGLSPVHMSNLETNQRHTPRDGTLERMAVILQLSKSDEERFYDLAAASATAPRVSGDLPDYIMSHNLVKAALRTAKDVDATDDEWQEFIDKLKKRKEQETVTDSGGKLSIKARRNADEP